MSGVRIETPGLDKCIASRDVSLFKRLMKIDVMKRSQAETASGPCFYWSGGQGSPLLLVHGGWAGAEAHWSAVWEDLAGHHTVIAIELQGIWRDFRNSLPSYRAYADACADLLSALDLTDVTVIGNSLGASIGWQLACDHPDLVRHLIMVNGFPPQKLPMRSVLGISPFRLLALGSLTRNFYGPAVFRAAFSNSTRIPQDIREHLSEPAPEMATAMFRLLQSVTRNAARPPARLDFIWGERDRLPHVTLADGRRLCSANPPSRLFTIPDAGHLPQAENPRAFLEAIDAILREDGARNV